MKHTIEGFSQGKMIEYGIDGNDVFVLRSLVDGINRAYFDGETKHYVLSCKAVIEDYPAMGVTNPSVIGRTLSKLQKAGIITIYKVGSVRCFDFGPNYESLVGEI